MRLFDYFCEKCDKQFEKLLVNMEEIENHLDSYICPDCQGKAKRVITAPARLVIPKADGAIYSSNSVPDKD